jgi:thioredoxin 1
MVFDMKTWIFAIATLLAVSGICPGADILYLNNGQKIAGTVTTYGDMAFHVQTSTGPELTVPLITVRSVEFADSATPVTLDVRPTGKIDSKVLMFETSKFVVATKDGEIDKIPASSVVSMQWGQRPPVPERPRPQPRLPEVVKPEVADPPAAGGSPSRADVVKGDRDIILEDHLVRGKVTVVDFYADWCGPCRMLSPKLEEMAANNSGIALVKINIINWQSPVAKQFAITGIPRVQVYGPWGRLVGTSVGVNPDEVAKYVKQAEATR